MITTDPLYFRSRSAINLITNSIQTTQDITTRQTSVCSLSQGSPQLMSKILVKHFQKHFRENWILK